MIWLISLLLINLVKMILKPNGYYHKNKPMFIQFYALFKGQLIFKRELPRITVSFQFNV